MNNTKTKFAISFLVVATLLLSAFAVAQQAQVRRMSISGDKRGQLSISSEPSYIPRQSVKSKSVETRGVVLPDFKPVSGKEKIGYVKIKPNPTVVAKANAADVAQALANKRAVFKRSGEAVGTKGIIVHTETKGIIDPNFKPAGETEKRGITNEPEYKPRNNARVTVAVGLESSMKTKTSKRSPLVKITPIAKQGVEDKGIIDPSFQPKTSDKIN